MDGEPLGRVVVGVFGGASPLARAPRFSASAPPRRTRPRLGVTAHSLLSRARLPSVRPQAASRFVALAKGVENVGYRRTQVDQIRPGQFIRAAGVRSFTYTAGVAPVDVPGGETADRLVPELEASALKHDAEGLVSLVVLPDVEPAPPKSRLVARNGALVTVEEPLPPGPNGTGFAITLAPSPELDGINLVVVRRFLPTALRAAACAEAIPGVTALPRGCAQGRVVEGQDVVRRIGELPFAKPNANSPYFQARGGHDSQPHCTEPVRVPAADSAGLSRISAGCEVDRRCEGEACREGVRKAARASPGDEERGPVRSPRRGSDCASDEKRPHHHDGRHMSLSLFCVPPLLHSPLTEDSCSSAALFAARRICQPARAAAAAAAVVVLTSPTPPQLLS